VYRFSARDPIGYSQGLNLYEATGANPTATVDPSGQRIMQYTGFIYIPVFLICDIVAQRAILSAVQDFRQCTAPVFLDCVTFCNSHNYDDCEKWNRCYSRCVNDDLELCLQLFWDDMWDIWVGWKQCRLELPPGVPPGPRPPDFRPPPPSVYPIIPPHPCLGLHGPES
jgi:hypothetical protein